MDKDKTTSHVWNCGCCSGSGFAVLLIIIGGFFLARDMGWLNVNISFWPFALLAFGIYLLVKSRRKFF